MSFKTEEGLGQSILFTIVYFTFGPSKDMSWNCILKPQIQDEHRNLCSGKLGDGRIFNTL